MKRASAALGVLLALAAADARAAAPSARAEAAAKAAYDRGVAAHARRDYASAAREFARADALAPNPVALRAALDAALAADDPALLSELAERSAREPADSDLRASVEAARKRADGRAGRVAIACPARCAATIDGARVDVKKPAWTRVGQHTVVVRSGGQTKSQVVDVGAGETVTVGEGDPPAATPAATPAPEPDAPPEESAHAGLPPVVVWIGVGATVVFGGAATFFAFETKSDHQAFVDAGCDKAPEPGCASKQSDGERAQTLANVGLAAAALAGVATIVVAVGFTDWSGRRAGGASGALRASATPLPGGAAAGLAGSF